MPDVIEINRLDELDHYHLAWQALLGKTRGASFFQSLPWLKSFWQHFGYGKRLRVLMVKEHGEVVGILPLAVVNEATRAGTIRTLTYPLHDWGSFFGPIGPNPSGTLTTAMRYIARSRRDWDLLDLRWTDKEDTDRGRTPVAMLAAGLTPREQVWKESAVVELRGTWDQYLAGRSTRMRSNIRRLERRFLSTPGMAFERYRPLGATQGDDDPRWELYESCVELAERSWQGSSSDGTTLSHEAVREFLRDTHALAAKAGALDLNVLTHHGRPIAFGYGYYWQGQVIGLRTGYEPAYEKFGLGTVLKTLVIRDSIERGDKRFDLGPGFLDVKLPWLTRLATSYRYTHYRLGSLRAQALRLKHWLAQALA